MSSQRLGQGVGAGAVWLALIYPFLEFALLWAAVAHLKVGLWRLFGYDIQRYFQRPFLSTNLVELWRRYSYHYREFLVRAFYYPVFLRCFRQRPLLRAFVATVAAAGVGNVIYHMVFVFLNQGATPDSFLWVSRTMLYFPALACGIGLTQVWFLVRGRRRRRAWSWGWRIGLDVLGVAGTFAFFILIRPLHHVRGSGNVLEYCRFILSALGIGG